MDVRMWVFASGMRVRRERMEYAGGVNEVVTAGGCCGAQRCSTNARSANRIKLCTVDPANRIGNSQSI